MTRQPQNITSKVAPHSISCLLCVEDALRSRCNRFFVIFRYHISAAMWISWGTLVVSIPHPISRGFDHATERWDLNWNGEAVCILGVLDWNVLFIRVLFLKEIRTGLVLLYRSWLYFRALDVCVLQCSWVRNPMGYNMSTADPFFWNEAPGDDNTT